VADVIAGLLWLASAVAVGLVVGLVLARLVAYAVGAS